MQAFARADFNKGVAPIVVPLGDLQDAQDIDDDEALSYNRRALSAMNQRYGAGEAVVAIAAPDSSLANIAGENENGYRGFDGESLSYRPHAA